MFCRLSLAVLTLLGSVASAQITSMGFTVARNSPEQYKVEGTVINAQTGQPLARALVEAYTGAQHAVLTGPEGNFSFEKIPGGTFALRVTKPGFFRPGSQSMRESLQSIEVGPKTGKVLLKLEPECVIAGEVVNGDGEPIEGVVIEVLGSHIVEGRRE